MAYRIDTMGRRRHKRESFINAKGYMLTYAPDHPLAMYHGYVYEHRLVVERTIGRILSRDEEVHHKDDNRLNNNPDNLEIVSEKDHQRLHAGWRKISNEWWRICRGCNQLLKVDCNFYRRSSNPKGNEFFTLCKKCYCQRSKKYRKAT